MQEQQIQEGLEQKKPKLTRDEKKVLKYQKAKLRAKIMRKKIAKKVKQKVNIMNQEAKEKYSEIKHLAKNNLQLGYESGIPIYIDLEYDILMTDREIRSLALQIAHIQGINKEIKFPIQLHLTNVKGIQKNELEKQGLQKWPVHHYELGLQDLIQESLEKGIQKEFIYLSPDADTYLESVDPEQCIYIVGGFVDRQVQKFMSLNKANTLQICSKKLPIESFIKGAKRPLNIDRVVAILSLFYQHKDWKVAYEQSDNFNISLAERITREHQKQE
ncbi:unnamed protein product (macronuclear) [Paramecium tetraurelia]|uniref:tRNA (guanine(9)-N(1))-methyltransferase n=1 Tax=Paramecium tetraurelia TaxID=5888 RepID=A0C133_PARTE|nr:uncharacterized protein GSPATT00033976001 [Paramecium tetraurelia]CAK64500.1 unnamed protein product [Paramecium tetraurelia]|eukprot:XP_001431898.1 hypothetical protein (macronuclear) [Paramecium tetraurelia strain d4-2]